MVPSIAIVGCPNVGKSTLFNCLTKSRDALVADLPGLTRDRKYGQGVVGNQPYIVIDTGGLSGEEEGIDNLMAQQAQQAIAEADFVLFVVDGKAGLTAADESIAQYLRQQGKATQIVVNKTDGIDPDVACADFHSIGLGTPIPIAAAHKRGINPLMETVFSKLISPAAESTMGEEDQEEGIKIAIAGRPNVGKSTLVNRLLGEERVIVYDAPGTTRDSIFIPLMRRDKPYTLIDTAGIRRQRNITEVVEKFSVLKTLQAIEASNVVVFLIDAREGVTDQDLGLIGFILDAGKAIVIAVNKWDGLSLEDKQEVRRELDRRLDFINFANIHFISAMHGSGVGDLYKSIDKAYQSATKKLSTPQLTRILEAAVKQHQPPLVQGRRIKLRYAHPGGYNPPIVVIHGNQAAELPDAYRRYLATTYRKALKLVGTPIRIELKETANPYAGRKNTLTPRQVKKRQRLIKHFKKKK